MDWLNLLIFVARGDFLRSLHSLLRLDGHLFKSQHNPSFPAHFVEKGAGASVSPIIDRSPATLGQHYLPEADAAIAGVATLTLICFGLASSRFGMVSVSTPFWYSALMASEFTVFASVKLRAKEPYARSTRR